MTAMPLEELRSSETSGGDSKLMSKTNIFVGAGLVALAIVCWTVLAAMGKPSTSDFVMLLTILLTPFLAALGAAKLQDVKAAQEHLKAQNETIRQQTNGTTSDITRALDRQQATNERLIEIIEKRLPAPQGDDSRESDRSL